MNMNMINEYKQERKLKRNSPEMSGKLILPQ